MNQRSLICLASSALLLLTPLAWAKDDAPSVAPSVPPATSTPAAADAQLISKGEYLARAADCVACHTAPKGKPFAGGLAIDTPIGKVYSTNITPDKKTGIGVYRL
jgi:mono/diheme cytochrome c family protein